MNDQTNTSIDPAAGLTQVNIHVPQHASDYPETIITSVKELFSDESTEKVLIGVAAYQFASRRDEFLTYQELRRLGYQIQNLQTPAQEDYFRLLVSRK